MAPNILANEWCLAESYVYLAHTHHRFSALDLLSSVMHESIARDSIP